ncbi:hypothetical protein CPC08DRAFT_636085 [Agrocybe pediades]|nr:hypothetical protein CPC08DRAFT_636085 [Agrocybe pediades]
MLFFPNFQIGGASHDRKPQSSTPNLESHNISALYQHCMSTLRAGTALWIPEGHTNLPKPCKDKGVSIGDVGILTPSGSFSFLFNICLPADHPVNRNMVPEGFKPIYPEVDPCDIREINEFMPWDYLSTHGIHRLADKSDRVLVSFQIQQGDGAVAVMPEGAISQDLENVSRFRSYAAAHLEEWYRYVNITRGREIKNGDLRLVIGCDKTTSWAIAAVPKQSHATTIELRAVDRTLWSTFPAHSWHISGSVQARVGPPLIFSPRSGTTTQAPNQCLFVRTMNLKLGDKEWRALGEKIETQFMDLGFFTPESKR